ncbi:3'-5' exoribonuclease YhaM family protein [Fundidesulfovibrio butyratiphilus]
MTDKRIFVRDLTAGQQVTEVFLLAQASRGQARNGPFWTLKLQDASGVVEAKLWSPASLAFSEIAAGQFVRAVGAVGSYRDQTQLNLEGLDLLGESPEGLDFGDFLPESAVKPEILLSQLESLLADNIGHRPWRRFCRKVLADPAMRARLLAAPGAKAMHHAYRGGLLEHTLAVCKVVLALCPLYPDLDKDTLLAAAAFHDLGKAWELTAGLTRDYTDEGRLLGHIVLSQRLLDPFLVKAKDLDPELALHFRHMLVSHHGEQVYGSPTVPMTAEAMLLHFADNIDAKLHQFASAVDDPEKVGMSGYVRALERFVYNPRRARPDDRPEKPAPKETGQCLLPLKA